MKLVVLVGGVLCVIAAFGVSLGTVNLFALGVGIGLIGLAI